MTVEEFFKQFDIKLSKNLQQTLGELVISTLGHMPEKGDSIYITPFEITVEDTTMLEVKSVIITTKHF